MGDATSLVVSEHPDMGGFTGIVHHNDMVVTTVCYGSTNATCDLTDSYHLLIFH